MTSDDQPSGDKSRKVSSRGSAPAPLPADAIPPEIRQMAMELGIDLSDPKAASVFFRIVTFRASPYPDTQSAREWESIYPGSAKAFIDMPQVQAKHRQSMERITTWTDTIVRLLGTLSAGAVALGSVYGAIVLTPSAKSNADYFLILVLLIVGVGGTNIIPRLIEMIPRFKITRDGGDARGGPITVHTPPEPLGVVRRRVGDGVGGLQLGLLLGRLRPQLKLRGSCEVPPVHRRVAPGNAAEATGEARRRPFSFSCPSTSWWSATLPSLNTSTCRRCLGYQCARAVLRSGSRVAMDARGLDGDAVGGHGSPTQYSVVARRRPVMSVWVTSRFGAAPRRPRTSAPNFRCLQPASALNRLNSVLADVGDPDPAVAGSWAPPHQPA